MYNRFKKALLFFPVALFLLVLPETLRPAQLATAPSAWLQADNSCLTVTQTSSSSFSLSWVWDYPATPGCYTITVTDLTTQTVLRTSMTTNQFATITGLTGVTGHVLRFTIEVNGNLIIVDTTMV